LIMYLMLPPQMAGGEMWMYQVYFSIFAILTGLALYLGLRRFSESKAFTVGLLYMSLPYAFLEFTFGVQDDSISFLFFFVPLLLLGLGRFGTSSFMAVLGFWTKMFNVLLFPWSYLSIKDRKGRLRFLGIAAILAAVVALPFLILSPEKFLEFPLYYFLNNPEAQTGGSGISPWHFLNRGGFTLPGIIGISMAIGAILISTYLSQRWKLTFWQGSAFVLAAFVIFYPKIAFIYFLMPVGVLLLWAVEDRRVLLRLFAMAVPLFLAVPFSENGPTPVWDYPWGWMAGLMLSLVGWAIFLDAFRLTLDKKPFPEADTSDGPDVG
ncbi:MAG TPA: hypothetical protein VLH13_01450, partial [Methanomassiliicoccales archaeon]|nr:hypothetical protein [Methanomassiliicoccales archaeon]